MGGVVKRQQKVMNAIQTGLGLTLACTLGNAVIFELVIEPFTIPISLSVEQEYY